MPKILHIGRHDIGRQTWRLSFIVTSRKELENFTTENNEFPNANISETLPLKDLKFVFPQNTSMYLSNKIAQNPYWLRV